MSDLIDCLDAIEDVKAKISPMLTLAVCSDVGLEREDYSNLFALIEAELEKVWEASDRIYENYKKEAKPCRLKSLSKE